MFFFFVKDTSVLLRSENCVTIFIYLHLYILKIRLYLSKPRRDFESCKTLFVAFNFDK